MTLSNKQIAGYQRRTLRTMRTRLMAMSDEWDGRDQYILNRIVESADAIEKLAAEMIFEEEDLWEES